MWQHRAPVTRGQQQDQCAGDLAVQPGHEQAKVKTIQLEVQILVCLKYCMEDSYVKKEKKNRVKFKFHWVPFSCIFKVWQC